MAQGAGQPRHIGTQMDGEQHLSQAVALGCVKPKKHGGPHTLVGFQGQLQILKHGELLKHRGLLKLAANAKLRNLRLGVAQQVNGAAKEHRTRIRSGLASDDVHHRGLACAVRPNDAAQLAGRNVQGQLVNGLKAIKTNRHVFKVQDSAVGDVHLARRIQTRKAGCASTRLGLSNTPGQGGLTGLHPLCALIHQIRRHGLRPFQCRASPTTPFGRNRVTPINSAPST